MRLRWMLGLMVLVLAIALAACGGGGDEEEDENGGGAETPAATKTAGAEETQKPAETSEPEETAKPEETKEPSSGGGGGATLDDVPVYPGADKQGDYSGSDVPLPVFSGDIDVEDYEGSEWAIYETGDSVEDVAAWYKDKMTDAGWTEENWFDTSFLEGAAWGNYTRDDGNSAAWVVIASDGDQTQIVIGAAHT